MKTYLQAEWKKTRKLQIIFITFIFLSISSFIGLGIYFANLDALSDGTQHLVLWGQLTFYYSQILFAPMIAIITGLSFLIEFERKTINMLKANNVSLSKLILSKIIILTLLIIPSQIALFMIYVVGLNFAHITITTDIFTPFKWLCISLIVTITLISLQACITVQTRNFSRSVATVGVLAGFVFLFLNPKLSIFYPYSLQMIALRSRALTNLSSVELSQFLLTCFITMILTFIWSRHTLKTTH